MNIFYLLGGLGGLGWIVILILSIFVFIAPIAIWRNTGKTYRLLALQLKTMGVEKELIRGVLNDEVSPFHDGPLTKKTFIESVLEASK